MNDRNTINRDYEDRKKLNSKNWPEIVSTLVDKYGIDAVANRARCNKCRLEAIIDGDRIPTYTLGQALAGIYASEL